MQKTRGTVVFEGSPSSTGTPIGTQKVKSGLTQLQTIPQVLMVVLTPEEEGGYSAYSPDVKGAISEGDSLKETLDNIVEAIKAVLKEKGAASNFTIVYETPK